MCEKNHTFFKYNTASTSKTVFKITPEVPTTKKAIESFEVAAEVKPPINPIIKANAGSTRR
jgi:hypothetical protein